MNHHRRRGFRSRPQKNGFRRRNNPQDHASQVYNISSNRNFQRNSLNPAQIEKTISKYQQLSKDAQSAGDPILSENYLQHAEHYSRKLSEINLKSDKPQSLNQNIKAERDIVNSEDNNSIDETSKKEI